MFNLNDTMRYFLCPGRTDMRKGISSLCGVVHEKMNSEVKNGDVFIFIGSSFRDGKQHAGITNCQSTDFRKLDFHFNASLAAVNLAKAACKRLGITYSISSCKSFIHNAYMLERFICVFGISPDPQVIDKLFKELILFTARAA